MPDASSAGTTPVNCWNLSDTATNFHASACPTALAGSINVMVNVSLDTDSGKSNPSGLTCAVLSGGDSGGAVWIASDMGTLVIGSGARINASGASGAHGAGSPAEDDGGAGGGSGGLIVLQAPSIMLDPSA